MTNERSASESTPTGPLKLDWVLKALVSDGQLSPRDASQAAARLASTELARRSPLAALGKLELPHAGEPHRALTAEALCRWLAGRAGLDYMKIDPLRIDVARVTSVVTYAYAAREQILPVEVRGDTVVVAVTHPFELRWLSELSGMLGKSIRCVVANPEDIERYLVEFYALAKSIRASEAEQRDARSGALGNFEQLMELGGAKSVEANDQHVVAVVDWLLQYAFQQRASDIHLEPRRDAGRVRFRIDGVLHDVYQMPPKVLAAVSSRLKILARMDVAEKRRPQDGRVKTRSPDGQEVELRLSTMPTTFGEKVVMRVFDPEVLLKDYSALGLTDDDARSWQSFVEQPNGIVLVTGPTGSGKTTTLYSTLKQLARPEINVCTIEDPIELVEPNFNQMQVQPQIDLGFATGVRTVLRQDPDIIMIGEIRDLETAEIAVQAALTGHLVLSTLHTNDAPSAITRLLDLGLAPYLVRATLIGVVAQRLVRALCPACRQKQPTPEAAWIEMAGSTAAMPPEIHHAAGCLECRATGYFGRIGLFEMMSISETLRRAFRAGTDAADLRQLARREGMRPLRAAGVRRVVEGRTSIDEVLRVTPPTTDTVEPRS